MKHELSCWRGRVYLLVEYHKPDTLILKRPHYLYEVMDGTGEAIQTGYNKGISFTSERQSILQSGATIRTLSGYLFLVHLFTPASP
jgi:hypothetical protein